MATRKTQGASDRDAIRQMAEDDLEVFVRLVAPRQLLGSIHIELLRWMERPDHKAHQLILLPRDHQKSRMVAYRVAWYITKFPDARILYISATSALAEKQLRFIKDILTSSIYRKYWPEMVHEDEGKRTRWTNSEIAVDHPKRKLEGVADPTIITGGLTTALTGFHVDVAVLDDVVVAENAYTDEGRNKVLSQYSLLASIEGADSAEWVVGTRYHPKDLYGDLIQMDEDIYDPEGEKVGAEQVYEVFQREVEDRGDGSGQFLWPRQLRPDGKWFGFDQKILAQKRAKYLDKTQFRAQYYNDPNDITDAPIPRDLFQYYEKKYLYRQNGKWFFKGQLLNVFAAVDFAFTRTKRADYTALVVVGIDASSQLFVLDIERIKTEKVADIFSLILRHHVKWDFRKLRAESTAAQAMIIKELKYSYLQPQGISLAIDEYKPSRAEGTKEERIAFLLEPRYKDHMIWHYEGGECQTLEEELVLKKPPHDDVKDALASAVQIAVPPLTSGRRQAASNVIFNTRFGGVQY